jgi:hypothetical protein
MKDSQANPIRSAPNAGSHLPWVVLVNVVAVLVLLLGTLLPRPKSGLPAETANGKPGEQSSKSAVESAQVSSVRHGSSTTVPQFKPEQIVSGKVVAFAESRRAIAQKMAKRAKVQVTPEIEAFFAAAQAGKWEDITNRFEKLNQLRKSEETAKEVSALWSPILETLGVAEAAHSWPAQKLLDYGQAVLGSLKPGMVYVGGTDPGRFIPTLMNETSDGDRHVVLTQNALADNTYLQYVSFLYADQLGTLSQEDSKRAFEEYLSDAQKRLAHDQQFPLEPKQIRPGEDVQMIDGRVQVSGQIAVMAINEKLLTMIMDKNPDATFALEESLPLKSTYGNAVPMGPIMELRVPDPPTSFTQQTAAQAVDYWQTTANQLVNDPETPADSDPRKAYSKMASAQANLLINHNFIPEAEQAFKAATEICPTSPEAVFGYVNLLMSHNQMAQAVPVVESAIAAAPDNELFRDLLQNLQNLKGRNP